MFESLVIEGWRQLDSVDIKFHPRLTVITGANGAGKSTILNILGNQFGLGGYNKSYLATPTYSNDKGVYQYISGVFRSAYMRFRTEQTPLLEVGKLRYTNGRTSILHVPNTSDIQYSLQHSEQGQVNGMHIDSYRPSLNYRQVASIPTTGITAHQAYHNYINELRRLLEGGHSSFSPMYRMKEAITSMATFGEGNRFVQPNHSLLSAYDGFVNILKMILPESLGFTGLSIRPPEVVVTSRSGDFLIDAASGGIAALIDLAWRIYLYTLSLDSSANIVVTIDEPENHLHPSMQRTLMRKLLEAFPRAQFIIATHSPFMVSSVQDSNVYALKYQNFHDSMNNFRVVSEQLDTINKAGNANEILREVLGVEAVVPEWVEEGLAHIIQSYKIRPLDNNTLNSLRSEMASLGYGDLYPIAVKNILTRS